MATKKEKIEEVLNRGVEKVYPSKKALKELLLSGKKIKLYQGFDPSMSSLHLGNLVGVLKLKQFQELGHQVIFLVGDFTGMIGDPTDKSAVRQKLTRKEVLENSKNWKKQISKFLNFSGQNPAKIMFNSKWSDKVGFKDLIEIASNFTVQQMIQRDFFQQRIKKKRPIYLHEFLYPVAQAIDCVKMNVDLEIGGSDQTFNMLAGRRLMKAERGKEKFVLTTKLLVDKEGRKVGKTTGNAVFLNLEADEMFGRLMAFPDEAIIPAFELLTLLPMKKINSFRKRMGEGVNPMELKKELSFEIVRMNHGKEKAQRAQKEFERIFKKKEFPERMPEVKITKKQLNIPDLLVRTKLTSSKGEAKRLVLQGAVRLDAKKERDWQKKVKIKKGMVVQVGKKRFVRIG